MPCPRPRLTRLAAPGLSPALAALALVACAQARPAPSQAIDPGASLVARGDAYFAHRANPEDAERAMAAWREAVETKDDAAVRLKLARGEAYLAGEAEIRERLERYRRAAEHARRALELSGVAPDGACEKAAEPAHAAALFWWAEALDAIAGEVGVVAGAPERRLAFCLAERAAKLDPEYFHAGPLRLYGRLLAEMPALLGGDLAKSRATFEQAMKVAPGAAAIRVDFAGSWAVKAQDRAAFDEALRNVLRERKDPPEIGPENEQARERARTLRRRAWQLF